MKNYLLIIGFFLVTIGGIAQTEKNKIGFAAGFGFQQYRGDLGNGFYFFKTCNYGVGSLSLAYYLNKSFDAGIFGTLGDYGYCQPSDIANKEIPVEDRCPGCIGRSGMGNLNSRLTTGGIMIKYKLANGYLLKEETKLKPYIYAGTAINHVTDIMKKDCVNPGDYYSINSGIGFKYYIDEKVNVGCNVGFGYLGGGNASYMMKGKNDMYMQNTIELGIDLF